MKKMKVVLILVLAIAVLALGACNSGNNGYEDPVTPPDTTDPGYEDPGYDEPITLPGDIDPDDVHELTGVEILVNGTPLVGVSALIIDDEIWPTHVPLAEVANALGVTVYGAGEEIGLEGLNGMINFIIGSEDFEVNGETVTLWHSSVRHNGEVYVPIAFFRDVFGGGAFVDGGMVVISSEADDMH